MERSFLFSMARYLKERSERRELPRKEIWRRVWQCDTSFCEGGEGGRNGGVGGRKEGRETGSDGRRKGEGEGQGGPGNQTSYTDCSSLLT